MDTNKPSNDDRAFRKLLKEWRMEASPPPHFQDSVWRRIERAKAPASRSVPRMISDWFATALAHPAGAAAYIAVVLVVGGGAGWTQAYEKTARVREELGRRYVRALDPYQTPLYSLPLARHSVGQRLVRRLHPSRTI